MNSTSSFSYWERTAFIDDNDVIIIGSGLVGLSAALHLKKHHPRLKVLVLERGFLPSGASTKNAGFACFGTVSEQLGLLNKANADDVLHLAKYKWNGLQRLRNNLGDNNIGYRQHGGYELFMDGEEDKAEECISHLKKLNDLLGTAITGHDIYSVANAKITEFGFAGVSNMLYNPFEGQIHTGLMMRTLLYKVLKNEVQVLNNCGVISIASEGRYVHIETTQGMFKTNKVILATNAFAAQLYPDLEVSPGRGQVLVTKPITGIKIKGTYHFNEGYYYFRNIENRVLFGGGRNIDFEAEATHEFCNTAVVKEKLTQYLNDIILPGQNAEIDYWWSGIMGFGENINPIVKQVEPNIFCAVRCNGMGIAMGSLIGEEVAELAMS
ncbi:NAD(P)/FAD-dependent oxidoreductase [Mucilaginibacter segetis]|uniref:FAD-binding oxidoreductase n=1 Tax=Mucilaginibacter segetis TaxID=2793071 RepID=A0A934PVM0_9SPHI|nr:FAD-dependent oxidoreductase [Mucilaginibacter segetis]MBK0379925.1 FAD-binding oxidoreductase [Mucilaginibacter segetis]